MKVYHPAGTKERLLEMFQNVNKIKIQINESDEEEKDLPIIKKDDDSEEINGEETGEEEFPEEESGEEDVQLQTGEFDKPENDPLTIPDMNDAPEPEMVDEPEVEGGLEDMFMDSGEDNIEGGLGDNAEPSDFDPDQVAKGLKIEMEHTNDPKIALEIAMDHLTEDPIYYDKLENMENGDQEPEENILLDPSKHLSKDYAVQSIDTIHSGDIEETVPVGSVSDPEVGEDNYIEQQNIQDSQNLQFEYDNKGNWIPKGYENKGFGLRPVDKPMGSGNEVIYVIKFNPSGEFDIVDQADNYDDAKARIFDYIK